MNLLKKKLIEVKSHRVLQVYQHHLSLEPVVFQLLSIPDTEQHKIIITENSNFIQLPDHVIGVEKIFKFDSSSISGGMFSIKYQLFLNDLYYFNSVELLQYSMVKSYLEDIDFLLTPERQIRFNKKQGRLIS